VLGVFVYPMLLALKRGWLLVALATALLALLFVGFDRAQGAATVGSNVLAALWALVPVAAGVLAWRLSS
jgi:hypothetical protein